MTTPTISTGKEIINATQNAVIEAAENVAEMIDNPDPLTQHAHEAFYQGAEFWVAAAFVLTVALLSRPIYKAVKGMIVKHIDSIRNELNEAEQLQTDAEKLLASYERKFRKVNEEAENILKKSQNEIEYLKKASLSRLEQDMAQKEKDVAEKLQGAKDSALQEIAAVAGSISIKTVETLIQSKLQAKDIDKLIDTSISKIDKAI
ncbi:MAG: hypothetical protein IJ545_02495 [Alphaproteobacteria bacterium]|nr:hypothetical protein [Alphaproteobacteria bacterium]